MRSSPQVDEGSAARSGDSVTYPCNRPTRQAVRRGTFTSVKNLISAIETYIDAWNERCEPFVWTKDAGTILAKATHRHNRNTDTTSVTDH